MFLGYACVCQALFHSAASDAPIGPFPSGRHPSGFFGSFLGLVLGPGSLPLLLSHLRALFSGGTVACSVILPKRPCVCVSSSERAKLGGNLVSIPFGGFLFCNLYSLFVPDTFFFLP